MFFAARRVPQSGGNHLIEPPGRRYSLVLVWGVAGVLAYRFYSVITTYAVNLFFFDEWDIYDPLFHGSPWWRFFLEQHGPHRQGLGVTIVAWLLKGTHWNSRVQACAIGAAIVLAMGLAVRLKTIVFGSLSFLDIIIPAIFLGLGQWEILLSSPGPSDEAFSLLLLVLYCQAWVQRRAWFRYTAIVALNFLLIYTGFGIFVAVVTLTLLAVSCYQEVKADTGNVIGPFLAWVAGAVSLGSFFYGYVFNPAADCFHFPYGNPAAYPRFMGLIFAKFLGIKYGVVFPPLVGITVVIIVVGVLARNFWLVLKHGIAQGGSLVVVILTVYSLLYAAATAIGRVCLGMEAAAASRYLTLLIPAFLGIYFHLLMSRRDYKRNLLLAGLLVAVLPSCVQRNHKEIEGFSAMKHAWKDCYRATENIHYCDAFSQLQLYPRPEATHLQDKLNYLKQNRLNLYANAE
jgi:hypothetical protein